jgi:UDP-N-acetylglucosamine 2-epimerase
LKVVTVIGNRPQFVKAAAVSRALRERHDEVLVHTGQHYDDDLSAIFFTELGVPRPDHELGLGTGTNTEQTGRMLGALGPLLADEQPDVVLVYGDTNSTLAGGLAAAQAGVPVAHVEAELVVTPPLGYLDFTALLVRARAVLTDSGGVQKEAYLAEVPCVTLRDTTEWVETVEVGWNVLVDLDADAALAALERRPPAEHPLLYGDGRAAERVVGALEGALTGARVA